MSSQHAATVSSRWLEAMAASVREVVLGVNDGLVSITGLVVGVGASGMAARLVLLAGLAATAAATVSMAVGTYLAAAAEYEYQRARGERVAASPGGAAGSGPAVRAAVMGLAVVLGSLPPLLPFLLPLAPGEALGAAVVLAAVAAFGLGVAKGRLTRTAPWRSGIVFLGAAAFAAACGMLVGRLLGSFP
jgi:predicted membrane protein (TIGR00267 family)